MIMRMITASFVTLFALIQCVFSGTLAEPKEEATVTAKRPRVGLALPTLMEERWHRDLDNMVIKAKEFGIDLIVQITMNDQNQQNFTIEQLLTLGADVLIIAPHDSFGVGKFVEQAHDAGIKVISYDRLIMNSDIDLYVSYDNYEIGRLQGRFLADNAENGNYIILSGPRYDSNARFYKEGAMHELQPLIGSGAAHIILEKDVPDWNPNTSKVLVETAIINHPEGISAVLAPNDGMAMGAITALKQHNLEGKVLVTGQDADAYALKRIMDGTQSMTIFKDISKEVETALTAAVHLARDESIDYLVNGNTINNGKHDVPAILLPPVVIHKGNLNDVLYDAGHITKKYAVKN